ncbi:MAG: GH32 C-terminal domain-containing protein [Clostridia bacterium]|nr:GH32 C-terminal domain-containing protein [Clostridia bacterium]
MSIRRKIALSLTLALMAVCLIAGLCTAQFKAFAYTDAVEITSNTGDTFKAEDASFDKDAAFVFSATVNFSNGDAAALTFGETEEGLWAFNIDRVGNRVKLLYFTKTEEGFSAKELLTEYFIGNDKMTKAEQEIVNPKVRQVSAVRLKVVITPQEDSVFAEFYADGIRRYAYTDGSAPANDLDLNAAFGDLKYTGGNLGYNVCNADVAFTDVEIGAHDCSYYTEMYRNQFHFSPFAHWNNDPNGLVYYNGYYHLYYQHYPFGSTWGDMYWGHARSTDLIHWENLPICLYPEKAGVDNGSFDNSDGYMWSGSVRIYHKGESTLIESENWFGDLSGLKDGDGAGLIGFYTRDGGKQDQMVMSSDDGGLTWTKRKYIPSQQILGLGDNKTDCRDPKVFTYDDNGTTVFGMLLTGMCEPYNVWFLSSYDMVNWRKAGGFNAKVPLVNTDATNGPECPDIAFIEADNGVTKAVITLAGRGYLVGDLTYENNNFVFKVDGKDVSTLNLTEVPVQQMDFGPDSYATQTFYIDDGEYAGKTVSVSWFSGVPGASASVDSGILTQLRSRWNCGMTIPVIWGLHFDGNRYLLTQTPITKDNAANKTTIASVTDYAAEAGKNILNNLSATDFEIDAVIKNPECGAVAFRVRVGENEYTEIGWNEEDGYYLDRTHTASGTISLPNYADKFSSHLGDGAELKFYVLCDEGSVEVFCGDGVAPFYAVTFSAPQSSGVSFIAEKDVEFTKLEINKINTAWRDYAATSYLNVVRDNVEIDLNLCRSKDINVYGAGEIDYEVVSGKNAVSYMETATGLTVFGESAGEAVIKVTCGDKVAYISVTVYGGEADSDCDFNNITSGDWYESSDGYIGYIAAGDAFIFSEREGQDFMYSAKFDLNSGIAAALVFRAKADMSQYIVANYDNGAGLVKLWSSAGDSVNVAKRVGDLSDVVLTVIAEGYSVKVYLNQELVIDCTLCENAPTSGVFGLNVCAANVLFKYVSVSEGLNTTYTTGDICWSHTDAAVFTVVNRSLNNESVDSGFYTVEGRRVTISQNYMASLPRAGEYLLEVRGQNSLYHIVLNVESVPSAVWQDVELQENSNAVFFIGNITSGTLTVNGQEADTSLYKIEGMHLTVYAAAFRAGENEISFTENLHAKVTVNSVTKLEPHFNEGNGTVIYTVLFVIIGAVIFAEIVLITVILLKKGKEDGSND